MSALFAYYVHQLSPFIIRFTETFGLRWYGFAYLLGAIVGIVILTKLAQRGYGELQPEAVTDYIVYTSLFGVMLGGRLGYMLLYDLHDFIRNPLIFFHVTGGGMASHGGILGVVLFTLYYAKRHRLSWPGLGDNLVVVAPLGIFFGRLANFINGELYGRPTDVPWAVQFPEELRELAVAPSAIAEAQAAAPDLGILGAQDLLTHYQDPRLVELFSQILSPRHPSQLYEAILEGLLLTAILLPIRLKWKHAPHGLLTGIFFILYAIFRMIVERFREPDAELILGLTRGQFYSTFMIIIGLAFLAYAFKQSRQLRPHD